MAAQAIRYPGPAGEAGYGAGEAPS